MEKFQQTFSEWKKQNEKLFVDCYNYLHRVLSSADNNRIELDVECNNVTVPYDGGRHPEYDSNAFSEVSAVFLKNNDIYLDTEDCSEYCVNNIDASDIYSVANAVENELS